MSKKPNIKEERTKRLKKRVKQGGKKERKESNSCTKLCDALEELGYVEVRSYALSKEGDKIQIEHRVHDRRAWTPVQSLLFREEKRVGGEWKMFTGIQFHENPASKNGVGYLWVLVLHGNVDRASNDICRVLDLISSNLVSLPVNRKSKKSRVEFTQRGNIPKTDSGVVYAGGQVLEYPLMAKEGRNKPEVSLFAPVGSRKGAHYMSQE